MLFSRARCMFMMRYREQLGRLFFSSWYRLCTKCLSNAAHIEKADLRVICKCDVIECLMFYALLLLDPGSRGERAAEQLGHVAESLFGPDLSLSKILSLLLSSTLSLSLST